MEFTLYRDVEIKGYMCSSQHVIFVYIFLQIIIVGRFSAHSGLGQLVFSS